MEALHTPEQAKQLIGDRLGRAAQGRHAWTRRAAEHSHGLPGGRGSPTTKQGPLSPMLCRR